VSRSRQLVVVGALLLAAGAAPASADERFVAFGDSITFGKGDETETGGYPTRLANLLTTASNQVTVDNRGLPGETTAEGLSRLSNLQGTAADSILIMEGVNDLFQDVSFESITANLVAMETKAGQRGFGKVYLSTTTPMGSTPFGSMFTESILLAERVREEHYDRNWLMPDPHQAFYDLPNTFEDFFTFDEFHPNAAGYDELARIFADYIQGIDTLAPAFNFGVPRPGDTTVASDSILYVILFDPLAGVDQNGATLLVDGRPVATTVGGDPQRTVLQAHPGNLSGNLELGVDVGDRASPPNRRNQRIMRFEAVKSKFITGDVNRDGRVDGTDLVRLGVAFGSKKGDNRFDALVDFDASGRIDGIDLAQLAANFGLSSP
jgi:lysophospholipase L1-like esterase